VYGGLVAFGSNTSGGSAVSIERNMRLFNQTHPTLVVTYDNKYANLSYIFFGTFVQLYKQEVGLKQEIRHCGILNNIFNLLIICLNHSLL
jgi:hypothetical protein